MTDGAGVELYWIPLGAGATIVRRSGRIYERLAAARQHRRRCDLYHSALIATTPAGRWTIEMTPVPAPGGRGTRGVVAEGIVGSRPLGRLRIFRYEVRRCLGGHIPDLADAVGGPVILTTDPQRAETVLRLVSSVPTPVWGRDELRAGEMWNSNSVVAWTLARAGLLDSAGSPPLGGRAPGWDAGVTVARAGAQGSTMCSDAGRRPVRDEPGLVSASTASSSRSASREP